MRCLLTTPDAEWEDILTKPRVGPLPLCTRIYPSRGAYMRVLSRFTRFLDVSWTFRHRKLPCHCRCCASTGVYCLNKKERCRWMDSSRQQHGLIPFVPSLLPFALPSRSPPRQRPATPRPWASYRRSPFRRSNAFSSDGRAPRALADPTYVSRHLFGPLQCGSSRSQLGCLGSPADAASDKTFGDFMVRVRAAIRERLSPSQL